MLPGRPFSMKLGSGNGRHSQRLLRPPLSTRGSGALPTECLSSARRCRDRLPALCSDCRGLAAGFRWLGFGWLVINAGDKYGYIFRDGPHRLCPRRRLRGTCGTRLASHNRTAAAGQRSCRFGQLHTGQVLSPGLLRQAGQLGRGRGFNCAAQRTCVPPLRLISGRNIAHRSKLPSRNADLARHFWGQ
jgi:hypothetical protein